MPTTKRRRSDDDLSHDIPDAAIAHHKPFTDMHDVLKQLSAPDLAHLPFGGYLAPSDLRNLNACSTLFFHHSEQTHMRTFISSIVEGDIKKIEDLILVYSKIHGVRKVVRWVIDETEIINASGQRFKASPYEYVLQITQHEELLQVFLNLIKRLPTIEGMAALERLRSTIDAAWAILKLRTTGIYTPQIEAIIRNEALPREVANALINLHNANILPAQYSNFYLLDKAAPILQQANGLIFLHQAGLNAMANIDSLIIMIHIFSEDQLTKKYDPINFLFLLNSLGLLNQPDFDKLLYKPNLAVLFHSMYLLNKAGILTSVNFNTLYSLGDTSEDVSNILYELSLTDILTQDNFDSLFHPAHIALFRPDVYEILNSEFMGIYAFASIWESILDALRQQNPRQALLDLSVSFGVDDDEDDSDLDEEMDEPWNESQSTHTTSVHKSISESALRLKKRYGSIMQLDDTLEKIKAYIKALSDDSNTAAAKRAITRLIATYKTHPFIDGYSQVSILQLLALAFTAIHDVKLRIGTLEDALRQFITGLYEIQRGYNLSARGRDNGKQDKHICDGGTFNKIMEKLVGIHPDCNVVFITQTLASAKLPIVVCEEALAYLLSYATSSTPETQMTFSELMGQLNAEGLEVIWPSIKEKIEERLFDEFHSLYQGRDDIAFTDFIEYGKVTNIDDLQRQLLSRSEGYRRHLYQSIRSSSLFFSPINYLSEHRHDNAFMQQKYDEQFGLVLTEDKPNFIKIN